MCKRKNMLILMLMTMAGQVQAYGGGGGSSSSCTEPQFYDESPLAESAGQYVGHIGLTASANTDLKTLELTVAGIAVNPVISTMPSGAARIEADAPAMMAGQNRLAVRVIAKSVDGCWGMRSYGLER